MSTENEKLTDEERQRIQDFFKGTGANSINEYIQSIADLATNIPHKDTVTELTNFDGKPDGALEEHANSVGISDDMKDFKEKYNQIHQDFIQGVTAKVAEQEGGLDKLNTTMPLIHKALESGDIHSLLPIDATAEQYGNFNKTHAAAATAGKIMELAPGQPTPGQPTPDQPDQDLRDSGQGAIAKLNGEQSIIKNPKDDLNVDQLDQQGGKDGAQGQREKTLADSLYEIIERAVKALIEMIVKLLQALSSGVSKGLDLEQGRNFGSTENAPPSIAAQRTLENTQNISDQNPRSMDLNQPTSVQNSAQRKRSQSMD